MVDLQQYDGSGNGTSPGRQHEAAARGERLAEVWPDVARRLRRMLTLRGVEHSLRDDVVQEVALRALLSKVRFETAEDLYAWGASVARNLHIDLLRGSGRTADGETLHTMAGATDVEYEVERRMTLETALRLIAELGADDRAAILRGIADGEPHGREPGRTVVRRHRARQRLRVMLKGALGWTVLTRVLRRPQRGVPVLATSAALAPALLVMLGPPPHDADGASRPAPAAAPAYARPLIGELRMAEAASRDAVAAPGPALRTRTDGHGVSAPAGPRRVVDVGPEETNLRVEWHPNPAKRLVCAGVDPVVPKRCVVHDLPLTGDRPAPGPGIAGVP